MIRHVWTVLCGKSSIDRETNNISLFEVVEQLQVGGWAGEPADVPIPLELVTLWSRVQPDKPSRGEARIILETPGGHRGISQSHAVDLRKYHRVRNRARIPTIRIEGSGVYSFVVELRQQDKEEWLEVAKIPVEVQVERPVSEGPEIQVQSR